MRGTGATLGRMDLHVIGPLATPAERAAVDAVLGPPESGWVGGRRDAANQGHASTGGHAIRARRSQLLPALHAVQSRVGWISQPALNYISKRLAVPPAEAYGVATFYALYATKPRPPVVAHVCDDIACRIAGGETICADLTRSLGEAGAPARDGRIGWLRSPCLGLCDLAPAALITAAGETPTTVSLAPTDAAAVLSRLESDGGALTPGARPPPGRRPRSLAARAGRRRGPVVARGLPGQRRLRGADASARHRGRRRHRRGHGIEADGPRRRRVPDRPQVGRGRDAARTAALPGLQRRRIRARDVQGPGAARGRPVRGRRGDDDRGLRDRRVARLPVPPRRVPRSRGAGLGRHRRRAGGGPARTRHPGLRLRLRHRAPARRRGVHLRRGDGALRVDRGQARRAAQQAAVPGRGGALRQADGRQQRRDAGQHPADPLDRRRGLHRDRHRGLDRPEAVLPVRPRRAAGDLRGRLRGDAARPDRARGRRARAAGRSRRSCWAARPASSSGRSRSTCRSPSRRRAPPGRRSARA